MKMQFLKGKPMNNLYDVAKEVTLEAGLPWTDPRTGVTHEPLQPKTPIAVDKTAQSTYTSRKRRRKISKKR